MTQVRKLSGEELAQTQFDFTDNRLPALSFRYRARNFPESLNAEEHARWLAFCQRRLSDPSAGASVTGTELAQRVATLRARGLAERQRPTLVDAERDGAGSL